MTNQPKKATTRRKSATSNIEDSPIYFLLLELEDVLCFKDRQRLDLSDGLGKPAQWTVILGNNGVGKTSLLRCLAGLEMSLSIEGIDNYPILLMPDSEVFGEMWQGAEVLHNSFPKVYSQLIYGCSLSSLKIQSLKEYNKPQIAEIEVEVGYDCHISFKDKEKPLICYGYGATRRMGGTSLVEILNPENSGSLFSEKVSLINAEEWLLQTDYAVKSASGKTQTRLEKQFSNIISILKRILPDVDDIRIAPVDEDRDRPIAEFLTPYGWVRLSSLGLGYRTTIAWIVDLAVRLFKRYPDSEDPLAEPAIVLVDEIDLHMHPKWQRDIMQFLTDRFPNTQFIVTAHSPLVVQSAQDANIVLLRREGDRVVIDNNPEIIENWRVDQVLTSVFEMPSARPAKIEPLLQRRKELLTKPKLTESDRTELKELEAKIGTLPTAETSEDIKAMDIIRRAAKLLDKPVTEAVE